MVIDTSNAWWVSQFIAYHAYLYLDPDCALNYQTEFDDYVGRHCTLWDLELDKAKWDAITLVQDWLTLFCKATTEMSTTKQPMLSMALAIFCRLQDHLCDIMRVLPNNSPAQLWQGLIDAHEKLSEYYYCIDKSPFYTWATCMFLLVAISIFEGSNAYI